MKFTKYPSIENHYQTKQINKWLDRYPELLNEKYIITEKIHGANVQFIFNPNKPMQVGKRTCVIGEGFDRKNYNESFFDICGTINRYKYVFDKLQKECDTYKYEFIIYGEYFGIGIQKGI